MADINKIFFDPGPVFKTPEEVLKRRGLSREQKIKILCDWEYDARELEVAEEENMPGDQPGMLAQIHQALYSLKARRDAERSSPTKHGGGAWQ